LLKFSLFQLKKTPHAVNPQTSNKKFTKKKWKKK